MKKFLVALAFLTVAATSVLAQPYASYDPDPNVRLQMIRESQIGGS